MRNIRRAISIVLCVTAYAASAAIASDRAIIPVGVNYRFLDDKLDATIRASLAAKFQQGEPAVAELFRGACTCAPGYWRLAASVDGVRHATVTKFSVPNRKTGIEYKLDGAKIEDPEDLHRIAQHFTSSVGKTPVIRRLTTTEISQLWVVVPFDIEEPVYLLENGSRHFVVCLSKDAAVESYRIWWVDILTEYDYGDSKTEANQRLQGTPASVPSSSTEPEARRPSSVSVRRKKRCYTARHNSHAL